MEPPRNTRWWSGKPGMVHWLIVITAALLALCIALSIGIGIVIMKLNPSGACDDIKMTTKPQKLRAIREQSGFCSTPACIHTASEVLQNMDENVNPCDNFYEFACGGFLKNAVIEDHQSDISSFSVLRDKVADQLKTIIEKPALPTEPKPFKLAKTLYRSCMNETAIESHSLDLLRNILAKLGGWPVLEGYKWRSERFYKTQSLHRSNGTELMKSYFFEDSIQVDSKNSSRRVFAVAQPTLGLQREYLIQGLDSERVKAYYSYMVDVAVMFGAEREYAEQELLESLKFEMDLANISLPSEKLWDATRNYNPMTISQLSKICPLIPWKQYINRQMPPSGRIDDSEVVIVEAPVFFKRFHKLLRGTPRRIQANYVMWRIIKDYASQLNKEIRNREFEYLTVFNGNTKKIPRWEECVQMISEKLFASIGALYVRNYFHEDGKKTTAEMFDNIKKQFTQIVEDADWLDDETKKRALNKAISITSTIAYPDELLDDSKLEEFYENLELDEEHYLQGILNVTLFESNYVINTWRKPVNKSDWIYHSQLTNTNAMYSQPENSINLQASILQGAFFNNDLPKYMNYGGIGSIIGHEITHGFDDLGRQFDKDGNAVNWWAADTAKNYREKSQCIIQQYGNYSVKGIGLNVNGVTTLSENIADNGGIKAAYLAYNNWAAQNAEEPALPGLPYNPQQMFWISVGHSWCSVHRPESLKSRVMTDFHSPNEFRILGSISNMPHFSADFDCPVGSKMNPKEKCAVW